MSRRPARFTQADLGRAIREAKREDMTVEILPDGTIRIVPAAMPVIVKPVQRPPKVF